MLLATAFLTPSTTANPFGTVDQPFLLNQHREHERITRVALACRAGETVADGKCFETRSLDQVAGHTGTLGGVGSPDALTPGPEGPEAHCDEADHIDIPGYPNSRALATEALQNCTTHLHRRFKQGITFGERLLDPKDQKIRPEMVELGDNPDGTLNDCQFAGTTPFPGVGRAKCQVIEGLGRALHGVQDFYSHSNWADHARPNEVISDINPPGLGFTSLFPFFDFTPAAARTVSGVDANLTTGCFGGLYTDQTPGVDRCARRVTHHTMNKDHALIDDNGVATLPTHATAGPPLAPDLHTPRSEIGSNLQLTVSIAIEETKRQWTLFKENLKTQYGTENGNAMICALTRDDPLKSCYGRRIALVVDSSGSNTWTDPSNFRIAAARQFNARLITKAKAGPKELPDEVTVVDFDDSARIVYPMGDPSTATFDGIDSRGGTDIGSGMALGIDELVRTKPPPSTGDPFVQYEENKAGLVILTDGEDFSPANQIAQLNRAAALKIRVAYGFLAPPSNPVPLPKRSLQVQKRAINSGILEAILKTGGVFATIDSAAAQQNFVHLVYKIGITAINGPAGDAIELLPGLILGRLVSGTTGTETFYYVAVAGEHLRLTVVDAASVSLNVVIVDINSNLVVSSGITDTPNIEFTFEAGSDTIYRIIVTPPSDIVSSLYSIGFASSIPIRNTTTPPLSSTSTSASASTSSSASRSASLSRSSISPSSSSSSIVRHNLTSTSHWYPSGTTSHHPTTGMNSTVYHSYPTSVSHSTFPITYTTVLTSFSTTLRTLTSIHANPTTTYKVTTITKSTITHLRTTTICPSHTLNGDISWPTPPPQIPGSTRTITASYGAPICYKCGGGSSNLVHASSVATHKASGCTTCGPGASAAVSSAHPALASTNNSNGHSISGAASVSSTYARQAASSYTANPSITATSGQQRPSQVNVHSQPGASSSPGKTSSAATRMPLPATSQAGGAVHSASLTTTGGVPARYTGGAEPVFGGRLQGLWVLVCGFVFL